MDGRLLPEGFATAYEALHCLAYGDGGPGAGSAGHPLDGTRGELGIGKATGAVKPTKDGRRWVKCVCQKYGGREIIGDGVVEGCKCGGTGVVAIADNDVIGRRGGAQLIKDGRKTSAALKSEAAFRLKTRVDKRLRKLGRELLAAVSDLEKGLNAGNPGGGPSPSRVCAGKCGKIGDGDWLYCARCGSPMRDLD